MANLIIQENGKARTAPAVHGEEITIQAPCNCSAVSGVQIAGVAYPFYDAAGKVLPMGTGLFAEGSLIRVLIDTVNNRATIINHAITPSTIGAATQDEMLEALHAAQDAYDEATEAQVTANTKATTATYSVSVDTVWNSYSAGGYYQTISVSGIKSSDNPIADVILGTDVDANALYIEAWSRVTRITTAANSITLYANGDAPETAFTIQLKVVR